MDGESHYYVVLPSNASNNLYPNCANNYRVQLARPLQLDGKWEVALTQFTYPHNWYNIRNHTTATFFILRKDESSTQDDNSNVQEIEEFDGKVITYLPTFKKKWEGKRFTVLKVFLSASYFPSPKALGRYIANRFNKAAKVAGKVAKDNVLQTTRLLYEFDSVTSQTRFTISKGGAFYFNNNEIHPSLGLVAPLEVYSVPIQISPAETPFGAKPLLVYQTPALYVYCDAIEHQIVGDSLVPFLRLVSCIGDHGQIVEREFEKAYYLPVNKGYINIV